MSIFGKLISVTGLFVILIVNILQLQDWYSNIDIKWYYILGCCSVFLYIISFVFRFFNRDIFTFKRTLFWSVLLVFLSILVKLIWIYYVNTPMISNFLLDWENGILILKNPSHIPAYYVLGIPTAAHIGYSGLLAIWIKFCGSSVLSKNSLLIASQTITAINCSLFITKINNAKRGFFIFSIVVFLFYMPFIVYSGINDSQQLAWVFISSAFLIFILPTRNNSLIEIICLLSFTILFFIADLARTSSQIYGIMFLCFLPIFQKLDKHYKNVILNIVFFSAMIKIMYFVLNAFTNFKWDYFTTAIGITAIGLNYKSGGTWYQWKNDFIALLYVNNISLDQSVKILVIGLQELFFKHDTLQIVNFFWNKLFILWSGINISSLLNWSYSSSNRTQSTFFMLIYFCNKFILCIMILIFLLRRFFLKLKNYTFDNYVLLSIIFVSILHLLIETQGRYSYIVTPLLIMLFLDLYYDYHIKSKNTLTQIQSIELDHIAVRDRRINWDNLHVLLTNRFDKSLSLDGDIKDLNKKCGIIIMSSNVEISKISCNYFQFSLGSIPIASKSPNSSIVEKGASLVFSQGIDGSILVIFYYPKSEYKFNEKAYLIFDIYQSPEDVNSELIDVIFFEFIKFVRHTSYSSAAGGDGYISQYFLNILFELKLIYIEFRFKLKTNPMDFVHNLLTKIGEKIT